MLGLCPWEVSQVAKKALLCGNLGFCVHDPGGLGGQILEIVENHAGWAGTGCVLIFSKLLANVRVVHLL